MIFRTIGTGDDTQVVNLLKAKKIAQDELNASLAEQASILETDTLELRKLETAVANGATYEEAFASSIKNASTAAKEHAIQTKGASGSTDVFVSKQRSAQASLRATATASKARELLADPKNGFTIRIGNRLYAHKSKVDEWLLNQIL